MYGAQIRPVTETSASLPCMTWESDFTLPEAPFNALVRVARRLIGGKEVRAHGPPVVRQGRLDESVDGVRRSVPRTAPDRDDDDDDHDHDGDSSTCNRERPFVWATRPRGRSVRRSAEPRRRRSAWGLRGLGTTTVRRPVLDQEACTGVEYPVESKGRERLRVERKEAVSESHQEAGCMEVEAGCRREAGCMETVAGCRREADCMETVAGCRREADCMEAVAGCREEAESKEAEVEGGCPVASRDRRTAVARGLRFPPSESINRLLHQSITRLSACSHVCTP